MSEKPKIRDLNSGKEVSVNLSELCNEIKKFSDRILNSFIRKGFKFSEAEILLDTDYIVQRSEKVFEKHLLTFENEKGKSICLRPDLTIAFCIKYLKESHV